MGTSSFVQWSTLYFGGSSFGAFWGGNYTGLVQVARSSTALGTFTQFPSGTYMCILGVPVGSYRLQASVGDSAAATSGCFDLPSGAKLYQGSTSAGQFANSSKVLFQQNVDDCVRVRACSDKSSINTLEVEQLVCDSTCSFCTGTSASHCAVGCMDGRVLTARDGGSFCDPRPPLAPSSSPTVGSVANTSLWLSWSTPTSGGEPITGYRILAASGEGASSVAGPFNVLINDTSSTAMSRLVGGLEGNTLYTFKVLGINVMGVGDASAASESIRTLPVVPGAPVDAPTVSDIGRQWATIHWLAPLSDGGSQITAYIIDVMSVMEGAEPSLAKQVRTPDATASMNVTALLGNWRYTFYVRAVNSIGAGVLSPASVVVHTLQGPPETPLLLDVVDVQQYAVRLRWHPPESDGGATVSRYHVACSGVAGDTALGVLQVPGSSSLEITISGLRGFALYSCRVAAENSFGVGGYATAADFRTLPVPPYAPSAPEALEVGMYEVLLSWNQPTTACGNDIIAYRVYLRSSDGVWNASVNDTGSNATSHRIPGLRRYTEYYFAVAGLNELGTGQLSNSSAMVLTALPNRPFPPAAASLNGSAGPSSVALSWQEPEVLDGVEVIGYGVELAQGVAGSFALTANSSGTAQGLSGLLGGTTYQVRILAYSTGETSPPGDPLLFTTAPPVAPSQPRSLARADASSPAPYRVRVSWLPPDDEGGRPLTGYLVAYAHDNVSFENSTTVGEVASAAEITGLRGSTWYRFRVSALNEVGASVPAEIAVTTPSPTAPAAVEAPQVSGVGQFGASLAWDLPQHDGGSPLVGFEVWAEEGGFWSVVESVTGGSSTSTTLVALEGDTAYSFRVVALNGIGASSPGPASALIRTLPVPPYPPGQPHASYVGRHEVRLEWDPPARDGGHAVVGYRVWMQAADSSAWSTNDTADNATSVTVGGLPGNSGFAFKVAGINLLGVGQCSPESDAITTLPVPPSQPDPPVVDASHSWSRLQWKSTNDGGRDITEYVVEMDSGDDSWVAAVNTSNTSCLVHGLLGSHFYRVRVLAVNIIGASLPSAPSEFTTMPPVAPRPPSQVIVSHSAPYMAEVAWSPPADDGGRPLVGYAVAFALDGEAFVEVGEVSPVTLVVEIRGLRGSADYIFRVQARTEMGVSAIASQASTTPAPVLPAAMAPPVIADVGQISVRLAWEAPAHDGGSPLLGFRVSAQAYGDWFWAADVDGGDSNSTSVQGLDGDTEHRFRVVAVNAVGEGAPGAPPAQVRTLQVPPYAPGQVHAVDVGLHDLRLEWDAPTKDGGRAITGYRIWMQLWGSSAWSVFVDDTQSTTTSATISGLSENTGYAFKVAGINILGVGQQSPPTDVVDTISTTSTATVTSTSTTSTTSTSTTSTTRSTTTTTWTQTSTTTTSRTTTVTTTWTRTSTTSTSRTTTPTATKTTTTTWTRTSTTTTSRTTTLTTTKTATKTTTWTTTSTMTTSRTTTLTPTTTTRTTPTGLVNLAPTTTRTTTSIAAIVTLANTGTHTASTTSSQKGGTSSSLTTGAASANESAGSTVVDVGGSNATAPGAVALSTTSVSQSNVVSTSQAWGSSTLPAGGTSPATQIAGSTTVASGGSTTAQSAGATTSGPPGSVAPTQSPGGSTTGASDGGGSVDGVQVNASAPLSPRPPPPPVGQPTPTASESGLDFEWQAPNANGSTPSSSGDNASDTAAALSGYVVACAVGGDEEFVEVLRTTSTQVRLEGLLGNVEYTCKVAAVGASGEVGEFGLPSLAMISPPGRPSAPGPPSATTLNTSSVRVAWTAPSEDGGSIILGYRLWMRRLHPEASPWEVAAADAPSSAAALVLSSLSPRSGYTFAVAAVNSFGVGAASLETPILYTSPAPPSEPGPPVLRTLDAGELEVAWSAPERDGGDAIRAYQVNVTQLGEALEWLGSITHANETSLFVSGLATGARHIIQVRAENSAGLGAPSRSLTVLVPSADGSPMSQWSTSLAPAPPSTAAPRVPSETAFGHSPSLIRTTTGSATTSSGVAPATTGTISRTSPAGGSSTPGAGAAGGVPAAPGAPMVLTTSEGAVKLRWVAPATKAGDANVTGYRVWARGGLDAAGELFVVFESAGLKAEAELAGLRAGTYEFFVQAASPSGFGELSPPSAPPTTVCAEPSALRVLSEDGASLTCEVPPADEGRAEVELTFDLGALGDVGPDVLERILKGVAAALDEPIGRFAVAGVSTFPAA